MWEVAGLEGPLDRELLTGVGAVVKRCWGYVAWDGCWGV